MVRVNGTDNPFDTADIPEDARRWEREHFMQKVHLKLAKAGDDEQQERTALADIRRIEGQVVLEKRAMQKEKRYWLEEWYEEQEEDAYDKLQAGIKKIDARVKKLNGEKPR